MPGGTRELSYTVNLTIRIIVAAALAVILGNGSVVAFNNIRAKWFEDWPEGTAAADRDETSKVLPAELVSADNEGRQRLPSTPWKYAFVGYFGICGLYLALWGGSLSYEICVLCVLFVVLEMAISDQLYMIVPDQFSIALAVMSVSFFRYHDNWWEPLAGAGTGLLLSVAIFALGMLLFRTGSLGGADVKFYTCMGFIAGRAGIIAIFILTTLLFALYSLIKIAAGKGSLKDSNPMMPPACAACTIYFLFLFNTLDTWIL